MLGKHHWTCVGWTFFAIEVRRSEMFWDMNIFHPAVHWGNFGSKCVIHDPFTMHGTWLTYFGDRRSFKFVTWIKENNFKSDVLSSVPISGVLCRTQLNIVPFNCTIFLWYKIMQKMPYLSNSLHFCRCFCWVEPGGFLIFSSSRFALSYRLYTFCTSCPGIPSSDSTRSSLPVAARPNWWLVHNFKTLFGLSYFSLSYRHNTNCPCLFTCPCHVHSPCPDIHMWRLIACTLFSYFAPLLKSVIVPWSIYRWFKTLGCVE